LARVRVRVIPGLHDEAGSTSELVEPASSCKRGIRVAQRRKPPKMTHVKTTVRIWMRTENMRGNGSDFYTWELIPVDDRRRTAGTDWNDMDMKSHKLAMGA